MSDREAANLVEQLCHLHRLLGRVEGVEVVLGIELSDLRQALLSVLPGLTAAILKLGDEDAVTPHGDLLRTETLSLRRN